jgi:endonuclease YncB( thermonuclease family)
MQKFYRFWKKDLLNKIIVLVVLLIASAVVVDLYLVMTHRPPGNDLLADLFPTPTTELKVILTRNAATVAYKDAMATASVPPTITTMPITPRPTPTRLAPSGSTLPVSTPGAVTATTTPTQTVNTIVDLACLPTTDVQTGKAVSIVDGYTIKVLMDGLVYTVRYLGIELPEDEAYAGQASIANGKLVYGKEISLVADKADKDQHGRLLRYVTVGDTFVNLELVQQGLATTQNIDPLLACAEILQKAEQSALEAQRGFWKIAPAP